MSVKDTDILELVDRYTFLVKEYTQLALQLAPQLEKFGKYRQELELITTEFVKRKFVPPEPTDLRKFVEEEMAKRGIKNG